MKKRTAALAMACVMVLGTVAMAAGVEKTISVTPMGIAVDGQAVTPTKSDGTPAEVFAYEGTTYAPLRYLTELNGNQVVWDANDPGTAKIATDFESKVAWDAEYDVVVVGYGGAGAVAAVTAAENGAKTLVLEKAPKGLEGGNTRYSCELVLSPSDRDKAITYFKLMRGNFDDQSDEMIGAMVDGLMGNAQWLYDHGMNKETSLSMPLMEFPEYEGSESMIVVTPDVKFYSGSLYGLLCDNVEAHSDLVDVWYSSPAVRLIQDRDTGIIHGVVVKNGGKEYKVRAINGVIMACGGFENNDAMLENYAQIASGKAIGSHFNTGDGIRMCIDVGADLWHMSNVAGPTANFVNPLSDTAMYYGFATSTGQSMGYTAFGLKSEIMVGADGTRFQDDSDMGGHGRFDVSGSKMILSFPENAWCVMDNKAATVGLPPYLSWSQGMVEEVEKGWVLKADSLEKLAEMMDVNAEGLVNEVKKYNGYCKTGVDIEFGRPAEKLVPLEEGPYYAFRVYPTLTNTQGGARRDTECQVLDVWGEPIPHLYSAGEFGSFYCDSYNGGGNLGECVWTGRKAAENASVPKSDVTQGSLLKGQAIDLRYVEPDYKLSANQYLGYGLGIGTDLTVKVTYENDTIKAVEVVANGETPGIGSKAIEKVPNAIVAANSTEVDNVSGASVTSEAIKAAVENALAQVK